MGHGNKHSTFHERVDWIVKNYDPWRERFRVAHIEARKAMHRAMKDAGLYAPTTYWADCRLEDEIGAAEKILDKKFWDEYGPLFKHIRQS